MVQDKTGREESCDLACHSCPGSCIESVFCGGPQSVEDHFSRPSRRQGIVVGSKSSIAMAV